jgi:hypothetical protein
MLVSLCIAAVSCAVGLIPSTPLLWVAAKRYPDFYLSLLKEN